MANEFKVKKGLIVQGSGSVILDIQGDLGQLFSITDSLTGDLFTVSDISGIPIFKVNSDTTASLDGNMIALSYIKSGSTSNDILLGDGSTTSLSAISGTVTGTGTDNYITKWNGTTAIQSSVIYDDGVNVGIGTTAPDGKLHVMSASAGVVVANPSADDIVVENSSDAGINILSPDASISTLRLGSPSDNSGVNLAWRYTDLEFTFGTSTVGGEINIKSGNSVNAMYIDSSQNIGMGTTAPLPIEATNTYFAGTTPKLEIQTGVSSVAYDESVVIRHQTHGANAVDRRLGLLLKLSNEGSLGESKKMGGMVLESLSSYANLPDLHFLTADEKRLTIDYGGNVGVGTDNPLTRLEVHEDDAPAIITIKGGLNTQTTIGNEIGSLDFRSNDPSAVAAADIAGRIVSVAEHANGAWTGLAFYTADNVTPPYISERMRISNVGYVGIGTTSPAYKLDVITDAEDGIRIGVANALIGKTASSDTQLLYWNGTNAYYGRNTLGAGVDNHFFRIGGVDKFSIVNSGNVGIGTITPTTRLQLGDATSSTVNNTNIIRAYRGSAVDQYSEWGHKNGAAWYDTFGGGGHVFSAGASEKVRIDASGNVGIGTTTPNSALEVSKDGGASQTTILTIKNDTASDNVAAMTADIDFFIHDNNTRISTPQARIGIVGSDTATQNAEAGGRLCFYTNIYNNTAPVLTERMRIDGENGYVGIGTTTPLAKLHIDDNGATGQGLLVTGGGLGNILAEFRRDIGSDCYIKISGKSGAPTIHFDDDLGTFQDSIGFSSSEFRVVNSHDITTGTPTFKVGSTGNGTFAGTVTADGYIDAQTNDSQWSPNTAGGVWQHQITKGDDTYLNGGLGISFEGGGHSIYHNDGFGNFGIRINNYIGTVATVQAQRFTSATLDALHLNVTETQGAGEFAFEIADSTGKSDDDAISFTTALQIYKLHTNTRELRVLSDSTYDIGTTGARYRELFVDDITVTNGISADTLGTFTSAQYLRSDAADEKTAGNLTLNNEIQLRFGTSGTYSNIKSQGGDTVWDLTSGDLLIRQSGTARFTFGRTSGDFTATGNAHITGSTSTQEVILTNTSSVEKASMIYNSTDNSLDFIFA